MYTLLLPMASDFNLWAISPSRMALVAAVSILAAAIVAYCEIRRRARKQAADYLDALASAVAFALAAGIFAVWAADSSAPRGMVWGFLLWSGGAAYLWHLGTRASRQPKPSGEVACTFLILASLSIFLFAVLGPRHAWTSAATVAGGVCAFAAWIVLRGIKHRFRRQKKEHLLIAQISARGDVLQEEYHRATPECPHPERWHMYDSLSAEVEVLDFLRALVIALKPELVVETGTFSGLSTLRMAEGLQANGFGRILTCELDKETYDAARRRFEASGLGSWIEARNESSLEMRVDGRIDLLFCDSEGPLREQEVRRFLPQMNPHGLILIHDASSSQKTVRQAALRLENEGLVSVLLVPTPRGLVMAQKREGRG